LESSASSEGRSRARLRVLPTWRLPLAELLAVASALTEPVAAPSSVRSRPVVTDCGVPRRWLSQRDEASGRDFTREPGEWLMNDVRFSVVMVPVAQRPERHEGAGLGTHPDPVAGAHGRDACVPVKVGAAVLGDPHPPDQRSVSANDDAFPGEFLDAGDVDLELARPGV
jgi:hypothetical protein